MTSALPSPDALAAQAARRLNFALGRDGAWRGRCPACAYPKPTLAMKVEGGRIAVSCAACGSVSALAAIIGLPADLVVAPKPNSSNVTRALDHGRKRLLPLKLRSKPI